jgi:hypothetical protein
MPSDTLTNAPPLDLSDHRGEIEDLGGADRVSEMVGRPGYMANFTVDDCLPPSGRGPREPATFDRSYFPIGEAERVLVDVLSGGSEAEIEQQRTDRHCDAKTAWCEALGVKYIVHVDPTLTPHS